EQLVPGTGVYNIPTAVRLVGRLEVAALEASLNEVVRRHEALRTTFACGDGKPLQVILPTLSVPLPSLDLRPLPPADRDTQARELAAEEARQPFDLARGPIFRAKL